MRYLTPCIALLAVCISGCINSCVNQTAQKKVHSGIDAELYKDTPSWNLVHAMDIGNFELAREEIRNDSSLVDYIEPIYGNSVLFWAALNSNEKAVELLLTSGAEVNKCSFSGDSPLEMAAFYNPCKSPILKMMLAHQPKNDSLTSYLKNEALIEASKNCLSYVKLLVDYKAIPSWVSKRDNVFKTITPLAMSVVHEKFDIVEYYLFECRVEPSSGNIINNKGDTILMTDILWKSYNAERTFDQEKTRQQIRKILDFLEKNGYGDN